MGNQKSPSGYFINPGLAGSVWFKFAYTFFFRKFKLHIFRTKFSFSKIVYMNNVKMRMRHMKISKIKFSSCWLLGCVYLLNCWRGQLYFSVERGGDLCIMKELNELEGCYWSHMKAKMKDKKNRNELTQRKVLSLLELTVQLNIKRWFYIKVKVYTSVHIHILSAPRFEIFHNIFAFVTRVYVWKSDALILDLHVQQMALLSMRWLCQLYV